MGILHNTSPATPEASRVAPETWDRSSTIGLANARCVCCAGLGTRINRAGQSVPCACVLRAIFKACHNRFRRCVEQDKSTTCVQLERIGAGGRSRGVCFGRKTEEFIADFYLMAQRILTPGLEWDLFRYHYLLGADWSLCARRLGLTRGNIFHAFYRIEERLGGAFRETVPYSLYPLDGYFGNGVRGEQTGATFIRPVVEGPQPLRAPLRQVA